jgi:outer membrane biosynthesis protein TonB
VKKEVKPVERRCPLSQKWPPPEPIPSPAPEPDEVEEETDDFPVDEMDLPTFTEVSSLNPVGSVDMDPLMQVYLERLKQIIMQHFNPPSGMNVPKNTKTTVQFTVDRFGAVTDITLRRSSGNKTWDHLSMRAVQFQSA